MSQSYRSLSKGLHDSTYLCRAQVLADINLNEEETTSSRLVSNAAQTILKFILSHECIHVILLQSDIHQDIISRISRVHGIDEVEWET